LPWPGRVVFALYIPLSALALVAFNRPNAPPHQYLGLGSTSPLPSSALIFTLPLLALDLALYGKKYL
jgi:hypothetical protein